MDERGTKVIKAEQTWIGWDTTVQSYSDYFHMAYNSWPENPLKDSRL